MANLSTGLRDISGGGSSTTALSVVVRRIGRTEVQRLLSLRVFYMLIGFIVAASGLTYLNLALSGSAPGNVSGGVAGAVTAPATVLFSIVTAVGALSFGNEYKHSTFRITLSLVPSREGVFLGKVGAVVGVTACLAIFALLVDSSVAGLYVALHSHYKVELPGMAVEMRMVAIFIATSAAIAVMALGVSVVSKSQTTAIVAPISLALIVEPAVAVLVNGHIAQCLPYTAARSALTAGFGTAVGGSASNPWIEAGVCLGYGVVALLGGWLAFRRQPV